MNTLKVADFAFSVLSDTAAGAVFEPFGTVLNTDKTVLRQAAVVTTAAGGEQFFEQTVASGALAVGF